MFRKQEWDSDGSQVQVIPPPKSPPAEATPTIPTVIEAKAVEAKPQPSSEAGPQSRNDQATKPARRFGRHTLAFGAVGVIALAAAGWFGTEWLITGRFIVSTDDAYVQAYNTTLAAKVPGYVANVAVTDNTRVHAGDVIATTMSAVGKRVSEENRPRAEVDAFADAIAGMLCAFLAGFDGTARRA